jgi:hypothetical protein
MPSVAAVLDHPNDHPLYTKAELVDLRRTMLLYARLFPPGYKRNQKRQIAACMPQFPGQIKKMRRSDAAD